MYLQFGSCTNELQEYTMVALDVSTISHNANSVVFTAGLLYKDTYIQEKLTSFK